MAILEIESPGPRRKPRVPAKFAPRPEKMSPLDRQCLALGAKLILAVDRVFRGRGLIASHDDPIAEILGWRETTVAELTGRRNGRVREALRARLRELSDPRLPGHALLEENLSTFGARLGLTKADREVLRVAALIELHSVPYRIADNIYLSSPQNLKALFAEITGECDAAIAGAFREDSVLCRTGLLSLTNLRRRHTDLAERVDLLDGLAIQLIESDFGRDGVNTPHTMPMPAARLGLSQYPHLQKEAELVSKILTAALDERRPGVNILLYGPPGTGKTELARAAVTASGGQGFEIRAGDGGEEGFAGSTRLRAYALTQRLLRDSSRHVVLFDEVEDVLASEGDWGLFASGEGLSPMKGWRVATLEGNSAPAIWTCNSIWRIDPALQRRFTYCLEVPVPPRSVRRNMLATIPQVGPQAEALIDKIADSEQLTPADIERVSRVLKLCPPGDGAEWQERVLLTLGARPNGVDTSSLRRAGSAGCEIRYDPSWINASPGIGDIAARLRAAGGGRLCFAGPPGTGKTAFAKHLARQLDRPLHSKKASDLLSAWLGETEENLAKAFRAARADNAILLIDEADSFLQDRRAATRSWEITQVNEVLKQLEEHAGVVILSTNLFDHLDPAVLRRLDIKVTFGYIGDAHLREVFQAASEGLGFRASDTAAYCAGANFAALKDLALGDVAAAMRQSRLISDKPTPSGLFGAMQEQLEYRNRLQGRRIGF
jgi:transitional endoplasmic reticulum ATPase